MKKAQKSAVQQEAINAWKEAYALDLSDGVLDGQDGDAAVADTNYSYNEGTKKSYYELTKNGWTASFDGEEWTVDAEEGE